MGERPGGYIPQSIHKKASISSLRNFLSADGSSIPFLKGTREVVAILAGSLCISLTFLGVSAGSDQLSAGSSVLFGLLFIPVSYTNIIIGRLYKQSLEEASSTLSNETER